VRRTFDVDSVVGIGSSVPPGEPLYDSHREAVLALKLCVQLEKSVLFYDEKYSPGEELSYSTLSRAASSLADAFERGSTNELEVARDHYVRLVLLYSEERLEVVRSQFLATLHQLIQSTQRRYVLRADVVDRFAAGLSRALEEAHSLYQVIESFKDALQRLAFFASRAVEGPKSLRLTTTLDYLGANFSERLRLSEVARKAGFSVPAFARAFRAATGTSFLAYVRSIRVEQAKKLLRTSALSLEQVAQACGFQSQHHLIRSFKKVTGQTPGAYRESAVLKR
jgi:AraC-like DNA-binding protein